MEKKKVVLTYYYTGMMDKWHHKKFKKCDASEFNTLYKSVEDRGYDFVTLANELYPDAERSKTWKVVELSGDLAKPDDMTLYVHKFIACYEWLKKHPEYEEIWIVDSGDTEMLKTPEPKDGLVYTGYDAFSPEFDKHVDMTWFLGGIRYGISIAQHFGVGAKHGDADVMWLKTVYKDAIPYNSGVFGGKRNDVMEFLKKYTDRLKKNDIELEMVPFNYVLFRDYVPYNKVEVCTTRMTLCEKDYAKWWRHK